MSMLHSPEAVRRIGELRRVIGAVEARVLPLEELEPFLRDPETVVVSTAALAACVLGEPTDDDPLAAPRRVIADALAIDDDPHRQGALLQGALLTGDPRIVDLVAEARGALGEPALDTLACANSGFLYDAVIEFYLDWLEQRPPVSNFERVAAGLTAMRRSAREVDVVDVVRKLPAWGDQPGPAVECRARWPLRTYAEVIAPRLVALLRAHPRSLAMPSLLHAWGLEYAPGLTRSLEARIPDQDDTTDPPPKSTILFYPRRFGLNGVFARLSDVRRVDAMHSAIRRATTWGELRRFMPRGEFEDMPVWIDNGGEFVYHNGRTYLFGGYDDIRGRIRESDGECVLRSKDRIDLEIVPGFCDGDWPPFLEPSQDNLLPSDFCEKYGKREVSFVSGSWWEFPLERAEEMQADLRKRGYRVRIERSVQKRGAR